MNTAFLNVRGRPQNAERDTSNVIPFRRATEIVSYTNEGVTSPARNVDELFARITAWREYGDALHLRSSDSERAASVICLGDEGHVLTISCPHRWTKPWLYSEIVTRVAPDRSKPSLDTRDQWYSPDETTDLAGSMFFEDHIHGNAREIALVFTPNLKNNHPMVSPTSASPTNVQTQVREASPLSSGGIHELVTESERILAGQLSSVSGNDFTLIVERTLLGRGEANIQMDLTSSCHIEPANFSKGRAAAFVTTTGGVWLYVLNDTEYTSVCSTQSSPLGQFTQAEFNTALAGLAE